MPEPEDKKQKVESTPPDSASVAPLPKAKELTPEEQMAAFEDELKETDWGHQPC